MRKCEYMVSLYSRIKTPPQPQYEEVCGLTGHACVCPEDFGQCVRRTFALEYQARHSRSTLPIEISTQPIEIKPQEP